MRGRLIQGAHTQLLQHIIKRLDTIFFQKVNGWDVQRTTQRPFGRNSAIISLAEILGGKARKIGRHIRNEHGGQEFPGIHHGGV